MLDKYVTNSSPDSIYVDSKVTINRAPTDESVRLLDEFHTAAKKKLVHSIDIQINSFSGRIITMHNLEHHALSYVILFNLNDEKYEIEGTFQKSILKNKMELIQLFAEAVSRAITDKLIRQDVKALLNEFDHV